MKNFFFCMAMASALASSGCWLESDDDKAQMIPNSPPVFGTNSFSTVTDEAFYAALVATDADGDSLSFSLVSPAEHGTVELMSNGSFSYLPNVEYTGEDSFRVRVSDGQASQESDVSVRVDVAVLSFLMYSREAYLQSTADVPLRLNGRDFTPDATSTLDYDDLVTAR